MTEMVPWEQVRAEALESRQVTQDALTWAQVEQDAYITALGSTVKIVASLDDTNVTLRLPSDPRSTAA